MSKTNTHGRKYASLLLIVLLLAMLTSYTLAQQETPGTVAERARQAFTAKSNLSGMNKGMFENWQVMQESPASGSSLREQNRPVTSPVRLPLATTAFETQSLTGTTACTNLIANPHLNILEFGDGSGTADPWVFLIPQVYHVHESYPETGWLAYDGYSLILQDGDTNDPSPGIDMFGQGFLMPENLSKVTIEYWRASIDGNINDVVWGELWLLDEDGYLHWDNPDKYFVGFWEVYESEFIWEPETITTNKNIVEALDGRWAAIILYNDTDGSSPGAPESQKEWMLLDNITVTACYKPATVSGKRAYLPSIQKPAQAAPFCVPPSENPRDEYHSNRGHSQTGATCKSTLSNVDKADYYTFVPAKNGSHTLHLKNLPKNTEWSAMIFVDSNNPVYASGESGGECRIDKPGSGDKKVKCDLDKNKKYFIKVSAGSTPKAGSYEMKVVTP